MNLGVLIFSGGGGCRGCTPRNGAAAAKCQTSFAEGGRQEGRRWRRWRHDWHDCPPKCIAGTFWAWHIFILVAQIESIRFWWRQRIGFKRGIREMASLLALGLIGSELRKHNRAVDEERRWGSKRKGRGVDLKNVDLFHSLQNCWFSSFIPFARWLVVFQLTHGCCHRRKLSANARKKRNGEGKKRTEKGHHMCYYVLFISIVSSSWSQGAVWMHRKRRNDEKKKRGGEKRKRGE